MSTISRFGRGPYSAFQIAPTGDLEFGHFGGPGLKSADAPNLNSTMSKTDGGVWKHMQTTKNILKKSLFCCFFVCLFFFSKKIKQIPKVSEKSQKEEYGSHISQVPQKVHKDRNPTFPIKQKPALLCFFFFGKKKKKQKKCESGVFSNFSVLLPKGHQACPEEC